MSERIICSHCQNPVDFDGEVATDPKDGRPMHLQCRQIVLGEEKDGWMTHKPSEMKKKAREKR